MFPTCNDYITGTDVLGSIVGVIVLPSVMEYDLVTPEDFADDVDARDFEIDEIVGKIIDEDVLGLHSGPMLWPKGNYVWPGVELEQRLKQIPYSGKGGYGDIDFIIGSLPTPAPGPKLWEGTTEDLYARLDFGRTFDESFDDAMIRNTGKMRGGS